MALGLYSRAFRSGAHTRPRFGPANKGLCRTTQLTQVVPEADWNRLDVALRPLPGNMTDADDAGCAGEAQVGQLD